MAAIIGGGWLRDPAAAQFNALQHAAKAEFGVYMPVVSAGRTVPEQWELYWGWAKRLPGFSPAFPGNSPYALHVVNGGGAVDVGGRFAISGTAEHKWLAANGPAYGFAVDAVRGEPWHIQFTLTPSIAATGDPIKLDDSMSASDVAELKKFIVEQTAPSQTQLYRNRDTGAIHAVNIATGFDRQIASTTELAALKAENGIHLISAAELPVDLDPGTFAFVRGAARDARIAIAREVAAIIKA